MLESDRSLTDFNFYYSYLLNYLQSNRYQVDPEHPQIITNSIAALETFEDARRTARKWRRLWRWQSRNFSPI